MYFQLLALSLVQRHHGVLAQVVLVQSTQLKVILCIQVRSDRDIVLDQFQEFFLQFVDLRGHKERIDEGKVGIGQVPVVPHLLSDQQGAQRQWPPVGWLKGNLREGDQPVYVDEADDAALGPKLA